MRWDRICLVTRYFPLITCLEQDIADRADPSLHGTQVAVLLPVVPQLVLPVELLAQGGEQAAVPLLRGEVLADHGQVEDGGAGALLSQASSGADHEGALAHLSGSEDVAELPAAEGVVQIAVGLALHVGG